MDGILPRVRGRSVLAARDIDKYLAPGGMVLPYRCTIELCAIADTER